MKQLALLLLFCCSYFANAQIAHEHHHNRAIQFPDIPGYLTLSTDFHIHTVFSDGNVWPSIRVAEALRDSVDAISLTEHLEYQPHSADIPHPDRNRSYEIALLSQTLQSIVDVGGVLDEIVRVARRAIVSFPA